MYMVRPYTASGFRSVLFFIAERFGWNFEGIKSMDSYYLYHIVEKKREFEKALEDKV